MQTIQLKLREASAVLGVTPKDLQNLVQFGVLLPQRKDRFFVFDAALLLEAKVAVLPQGIAGNIRAPAGKIHQGDFQGRAEIEGRTLFQCLDSFAAGEGKRSGQNRNPAPGASQRTRSPASDDGIARR